MKTLEEVKSEYLESAQKHKVGKYVVYDPQTGRVAAHSNGDKPFDHSFDGGATWVKAVKNDKDLFLSKDGNYYELSALPENDDAFVTEKYKNEVKAERNARISDSDSYAQLTDITVQRAAGEARSALTEEEREALIAYRQELRDLPEKEGFPFVEYPAYPDCLAYELSAKAEQREMMKNMGGF
jgi:hypothetical protein